MAEMMKATVYLDADLWYRFRQGCLAIHQSASRQLSTLMIAQLDEWGKDKGGRPQPKRPTP